MSKQIYTIVEDIYDLFRAGNEVEPTDEQLHQLVNNIANTVKERFRQKNNPQKNNVFRPSNMGKGDRYLWYLQRDEEAHSLDFKPHDKIKFLYGDIIEELVLFLADLAGHEVTGQQDELEINGVKGSRDALIDGVTVDVKSVSSSSFSKFQNKNLLQKGNDPFGYVTQVSAYSQANQTLPYEECDEPAAILALDKSRGMLNLTVIDSIEQPNIVERINYLREIIPKDQKPEKCYEDEEDGKSGNRKLSRNCVFCKYKEDCWSDSNDGNGLRVFDYSYGKKYLTHVEKEPRVPEIKEKYDDEIL